MLSWLYHGGQNIFSHGLVLKRTYREQCHERKKIEGGTKKICRSVPLARTNATTRMLQSRTDVTLPKIKKMLQLMNTNSWLEKQEYLSLML